MSIAADSEPRRGEHLKPYHWPKGVSANPAGRPKGSRNKLATDFVDDLYQSWKAHGAAVIETVIRDKPADYLKIVASILPKELHIKEESIGDMAESDLLDMLRTIKAMRQSAPAMIDVTPTILDKPE